LSPPPLHCKLLHRFVYVICGCLKYMESVVFGLDALIV